MLRRLVREHCTVYVISAWVGHLASLGGEGS